MFFEFLLSLELITGPPLYSLNFLSLHDRLTTNHSRKVHDKLHHFSQSLQICSAKNALFFIACNAFIITLSQSKLSFFFAPWNQPSILCGNKRKMLLLKKWQFTIWTASDSRSLSWSLSPMVFYSRRGLASWKITAKRRWRVTFFRSWNFTPLNFILSATNKKNYRSYLTTSLIVFHWQSSVPCDKELRSVLLIFFINGTRRTLFSYIGNHIDILSTWSLRALYASEKSDYSCY